MSDYRIVYKWWTYQVYKKYPDGREHHLGKYFTTREQAEEFIKGEREQ